jgi:hypothetical protein
MFVLSVLSAVSLNSLLEEGGGGRGASGEGIFCLGNERSDK